MNVELITDQKQIVSRLINVPKVWAHVSIHDQEDEVYFERDMVELCSICRENMMRAIDYGLVCSKHPKAYFEPESNYCEVCDHAS